MINSRQKLYKSLSGAFDLGSEADFNAKMDNPESRQKLYSAVSQKFDLGSFEEFEGKVTSVKKKESTVPVQKSATSGVTENTSSATSQFKPKDERLEAQASRDNTFVSPARKITTDKADIDKENETFKQLIKPKLTQYRETTKITDQDQADALTELEDVKSEKGVLNTLKSAASKIGTFFTEGHLGGTKPLQEEIDEAKVQLRAEKQKLTPENIASKSEEIFVAKKLEEKKQQKVNAFLDQLPEQEKSYLEADADIRYKTLSKETKDLTTRINLNSNYAESILEDLKNPDLTIEDQQKMAADFEEVRASIITDYNKLGKSEKDLGSAEEEFDAFKRNYNRIENFGARVLGSVADLGVNVVSGVSFLSQLNPSDQLAKVRDMQTQAGVQDAKEGLANFKEEFRPDNKDLTLENFVQYSTDLIGGQAGNILAIASTGGAGATTLGVGAAGQKYSDMYLENQKGAGYSPLQMAIAPLVSGISEAVFSELPTISTLRNTARVFKATIATTAGKELVEQAVKKTASAILKNAGKDLGKEIATEEINNVIQNAIDKDILGKDVDYFDNSWKVLKDTALMTALISSAPAIGMTGIHKVATAENKQKLNEFGAKIIQLSKQLDNPNIDEQTKSIVEDQINEATKGSSNIVNETLFTIEKMPEDQLETVISNEKRLSSLKNKAQSVAESELDEPAKKMLLAGLDKDYKSVEDESNAIIRGLLESKLEIEDTQTNKQPLDLTVQSLMIEGNKYSSADEFDADLSRKERDISSELKKYYPDLDYTQALEEVVAGRFPKEKNDYTKPVDAFHGTDAEFDKIDSSNFNSASQTGVNKGHVFYTTDEEVAGSYGKRVINEKLSIDKPLVIDANGSAWNEIKFEDETADINQIAKIAEQRGFDALVVENVRDTGGKTDRPAGFKAATTIVKFDNESKAEGDTSTDGDVQPGTDIMEQNRNAVGESDTTEVVPDTVDAGQTETIIPEKRYRASENGGEYSVKLEKGELKITDAKGKVASAPIQRNIRDQYANDFDFTQGETAMESGKINDVSTWEADVAEHSKNPVEIAETLLNLSVDALVESKVDYKTRVIAENIGKIKQSSFNDFGDRKVVSGTIAINYFNKNGADIDTLAQEMSEIAGTEITEQDIIDFIVDNPRGPIDLRNSIKKEAADPLKLAFTELTGLPATDKYLQKAVGQQIAKNDFISNYASSMDVLSDAELLSLSKEQEQFNQFENEQRENTIAGGTASTEIENSESGTEQSGIQETRRPEDSRETEPESGPDEIDVDISSDLKLPQILDWLDKIDSDLEAFGKNTLSMGIPIVVAKSAVKAMKAAALTTKVVADIISAGFDVIQKSDWYKNLSSKEQSSVNVDRLQISISNDLNSSKVPQVVYHGTKHIFDEFRDELTWFTDSREFAESFGKKGGRGMRNIKYKNGKPQWNDPVIYEAKIEISKPISLEDVGKRKSFRSILQANNVLEDDINSIISSAYKKSAVVSDMIKSNKAAFKKGLSAKAVSFDETGTLAGFSKADVGEVNNSNGEVESEVYGWFDKKHIIEALKEHGFDGIIANENGHNTYAVFNSKNIKIQNSKLPTDISSDIKLPEIINWLSKVEENLDDFGKEALSMGIPIVVAKAAIKAMKASALTTKVVVDIISAGVNAIQNSDWYKGLSPEKQQDVDATNLQSLIFRSVQNAQEYDNKIADIRQKLKDNTISKKEAFEQVRKFLKSNKINGDITKTEVNSLITKASRILISRDANKTMDAFVDYYKKVQQNAENRAQRNKPVDRSKIDADVSAAISNGTSLSDILDKYTDGSDKRYAENIYKRSTSQNVSQAEAFDDVNSTFDKSIVESAKTKTTKESAKKVVRSLIHKFTDRQFLAKKLLEESGLKPVRNLIINASGASGKAKEQFSKAYNSIYKGLSRADRTNLDKIIQAKRFISIDQNRADRGLSPVTHPNFIDGNKSQLFLDGLKEELGVDVFDDLTKRADNYFAEYGKILKEMFDNGLITQESYDAMNGVDYQPRVFLKFITNFDEELSESGQKKLANDTGGLSKDQIQSMSEGDASSLVLNSEWLLSNSMVSRVKAVSINNVNKRFMTDDFVAAKDRFENLDPKNLKGDDARFYKYFKELNSKIIDNPIVGFTKSGNAKYKFDKAPANFKKAYYYIDGQQHQFFIEEELHDIWFDNLAGIFSADFKEVVSYASGAAIVKAFATGNNPAFPIVNTPRDFVFTVTFSDQYSKFVPKAMVQVGKDVVNAIKEIASKQSDVMDKYVEYGGKMDFLSTQGRLNKNSMIGRAIDSAISPTTKETFKSVFSKITLAKISEYSEIMFRLGIFQRTIANKLSELGLKDISEVEDKQLVDDIYNEAVANSRSIMDFNQGGVVTKDLEAVIPYLNSATQGTRVVVDAFGKDPQGTTLRVLQMSAIASTIPIGISLAMITAFKSDDDEDKSAYEIYTDAMDGLSQHQRSQYMNIVTGSKNEDGEYKVIKIAKSQAMAPVMSITDNVALNSMRAVAGKPMKSAGKVAGEALFAFNNNVMPVDVTSPAGLLTRTPLTKGIMTYTTGYDFFRDQPLSWDIGKVPKPAEGLSSANVEDFYKKAGDQFNLSPIRTKAFIEAMITTPSTNPFVGLMYGGADAATSDKSMNEIGKNLLSTIYKSTGKRVISYTSEFNRSLAQKKELQDKIDEINVDKEKLKAKFSDLSKRMIAKEITVDEVNEELKKLDPADRERMIKKLNDKARLKGVDQNLLDIKYERGAEVKALMIMNSYGDLYDKSPESTNIVRQMIYAKGIWTDEVIAEYNKLRQELKN